MTTLQPLQRALITAAYCAAATVCLATPPCQHETTISYNGGPVMSNPITVYTIVLGNFQNSGSGAVLQHFLDTFSTSGLWWAARHYCDDNGNYVTGSVSSTAYYNAYHAWFTPDSNGVIHPSYNDLETLVDDYVFGNGIADNDAMYIVVMGTDVAMPIYNAAGYHSQFLYRHPGVVSTPWTSSDLRLHYAIVSLNYPYSPTYPTTPNGVYEMDGNIDTLMHEIIEMAINPNGSQAPASWINTSPGIIEPMDACITASFTPYYDSNGAAYTNWTYDSSTSTTYRWYVRPIWSNYISWADTCRFDARLRLRLRVRAREHVLAKVLQ